ncbi:MAG: serine O-acetyltransferase [Flavobacteriaceae bacterium]|jgi:serine O-acetyltransferase
MNLVKVHIFGNRISSLRIPILPKFIELFIFIFYNSRVPLSAKIGKGTVFAYLGIGCVIHKDSIIGANCTLGQGITIGGRGKRGSVPTIGSNVFIGAGARILGPINIGDNVIVGPNAVIIKDVPSNSIVVGIPGRIVKTNIDNIDNFL